MTVIIDQRKLDKVTIATSGRAASGVELPRYIEDLYKEYNKELRVDQDFLAWLQTPPEVKRDDLDLIDQLVWDHQAEEHASSPSMITPEVMFRNKKYDNYRLSISRYYTKVLRRIQDKYYLVPKDKWKFKPSYAVKLVE